MQCDVGMVFLGRRERISMEEVGARACRCWCNHYFSGRGFGMPCASDSWHAKAFQSEGSLGSSALWLHSLHNFPFFGGDHWLISPKRHVSGDKGNDVFPASSNFHVSRKIGQRRSNPVLLKHHSRAREMLVGKMMLVRREAMGGLSAVKQFHRILWGLLKPRLQRGYLVTFFCP